MKFNTLKLSEVMVHRVPASGDEVRTEPEMSEAPSPHESDVFGFFRQRMSGVMANKGLPIEPDVALSARDPDVGEVLDAVSCTLADPGELVARSQAIAARLYAVQDGRNPAGILEVTTGEIDGEPCVGILKLEHERGVQAEQERNALGQLVFRVILHDDLLLTEKTAVFKSALFRRRSATDPSLIAEASDLQNQRDLAGFFLTSFLGCKLVDDPPEATRKYFDAAEDYVNTQVADPEKQARYEGALLAQMNSAVPTVDPDRFARENLDAQEHQAFLNHLKAAGANTKSFAKDTARIKARIKRVAYRFDSGIKLAGTPEAMSEHVEVDSSADRTRVTVTDEIAQMSGGLVAGYKEVLGAYELERPRYEELVAVAAPALQRAIDAGGLHTLAVTGRAKEPRSFAIKACIGRRYERPLEQITDKAGLRVMVIYQSDVDAVVEIVKRTFTVTSMERKLDALEFDRNGYLGTHLQAKLTPDALATAAQLAGLEFEVQVRTLAQSAWAEVSHAELYKPPAEVPAAMKRRIYRLVALVELIDNEVEGFCAEAARTEGYREAASVAPMTERMALLGNSRAPDRRLTRELCAALVPLYGLAGGALVAAIDRFIEQNEAGLRNVISEGEALEEKRMNPLLPQPELPLICERLENDRIRLEAAWPASVPEQWLDDLAEKWGVGPAAH